MPPFALPTLARNDGLGVVHFRFLRGRVQGFQHETQISSRPGTDHYTIRRIGRRFLPAGIRGTLLLGANESAVIATLLGCVGQPCTLRRETIGEQLSPVVPLQVTILDRSYFIRSTDAYYGAEGSPLDAIVRVEVDIPLLVAGRLDEVDD